MMPQITTGRWNTLLGKMHAEWKRLWTLCTAGQPDPHALG